jgi:hypothetical protein
VNRTEITARATITVGIAAAATVLAMLGPPSAQAEIVGDFKTPSGTVYCQMALSNGGVAAVACEGGGPQTGPKPDCASRFPWGDRISIVQGAAPESDCHTDTIRSNQPEAPILDYGQSRTIGQITCDSETSGLTCTDASTGHYFSMSREANTSG